MLPVHSLQHGYLIIRATHLLEGDPKALPVVESQIVAKVRISIQGVAVLGKGGYQRITMLQLVVDDHAVEIEEYAGSH
jgi:hypothetical protein